MKRHTLTQECKCDTGRVCFTASSWSRIVAGWLVNRQRKAYVAQRGLPPNFLLVVKETWS
jgi:hypothetical protein